MGLYCQANHPVTAQVSFERGLRESPWLTHPVFIDEIV
jgi:hypothetical protein